MARKIYELRDRIVIADGGAFTLGTLQLPKEGRIKHFSIRKEATIALIPGSVLGVAYLGGSMGTALGMTLCEPSETDFFPNGHIAENVDIPYDRNTTIRWGGQNNSGAEVALLFDVTVEAE